jgi:hypothetical protein
VQQALPVELGYVHGEWWPHVSASSQGLTCLLLLLPSSGPLDIYG